MIEIKGKYDTAKVFTNNVEEEAIEQIKHVLDNPVSKNANTRIMPDVHLGAGICIGYTAKLTDKVVPNFVGVDIGCGLIVVELDIKHDEIDFEKLDKLINDEIPSGFNNRRKTHPRARDMNLKDLKSYKKVVKRKDDLNVYRAIGTLGGGNHFIEINKDENDKTYLVIHTGSRNIGHRVASYYQKLAYEELKKTNKKPVEEIIAELHHVGKEQDIERILKGLSQDKIISKDLAYLEDNFMNDYLHDMGVCQKYASLNRHAIADVIIDGMDWQDNVVETFETIHNYIDLDNKIIRKGAVSAQKDEKLIIPMNMSWGSIICEGLGNEDWNCSAPHGAGRTMSRTKAKEVLNMKDYKDSMKDIHTTSVVDATLDEAPMAYKSPEQIIEDTKPTAKVIARLKPIYNFKDKSQTNRRKRKKKNDKTK